MYPHALHRPRSRQLTAGFLAMALPIGAVSCNGRWNLADADGDGYTAADGDCWDRDQGPSGYDITGADIHPGATDAWYDGIDADCAGNDDFDADADGYVPDGYVGRLTALVEGSGTLPGGDCWDAPAGPEGSALGGADIHPGAADAWYDGIDADCAGNDDFDADADGYVPDEYGGLETDGVEGSGQLPTGDCNDDGASVHPDADEYCNGIDDNCDGTIDEDSAVDAPRWYVDSDGDGYGSGDEQTTACQERSGLVSNGDDCDDTNDAVHPGADEYCNDIDDNCDGTADEDSAVDASTWYLDSDGDGYGNAATSEQACSAPAGYVADNTDCDDSLTNVHPGATEVCDSLDNDCDAFTDDRDADLDSSTASTWYADSDGDGYGDPSSTSVACDQPSGYVSDNTDCDDSLTNVHPGATEVCNNELDDDCDGTPGTCVPSDLALSSADAFLQGVNTGDEAGFAVTTGDVNGDGTGDVIAGAPGANALYAALGPLSGVISLSSADAVLDGEGGSDEAGYAAAVLGDVNGDGYDDLLAAAPAHARSRGKVYLLYGSASIATDWSGELKNKASVTIQGDSKSDYFGWSVAATGDITGDGTPDAIVGAIGTDSPGSYAGSVTILSAGASAVSTLDAKAGGDNAGNSVAGVGDVDGDGVNDVLVGAPYNDDAGSSAGAAFLVLGPLSADGSLADADVELMGENAGDLAGYTVGGAGDVDGDGHADLLVGAYKYPSGDATGRAYLVLGPASSGSLSAAAATFDGAAKSDRAGIAVAGMGDVDGDGHDDIAIGADRYDGGAFNAGAVYVFLGPVSGGLDLSTDADATYRGDTAGITAGTSLDGQADLNGDGTPDLVVGAPANISGSGLAGGAYVVFGIGY